MSKRSRDDAQRIEALSELMERHELDEVRLRVGETMYELVRHEAQPAFLPQMVAPAPAPAPVALNGTSSPAAPAANVKRVAAPLVGVFYRASAPGADPFVEPGDRVEVGQVLCIVEAMKLMNEITSDFAGTVRRVIPENGDLVALGEDLFWIEP